eukprot:GGOE01035260.1.p3 GENE.GGOE01035260.1~~GGOE01035260.1.p3  ORF type:complete len:128 (-),score=0.48 GGOE01035260.1:21-404(-)
MENRSPSRLRCIHIYVESPLPRPRNGEPWERKAICVLQWLSLEWGMCTAQMHVFQMHMMQMSVRALGGGAAASMRLGAQCNDPLEGHNDWATFGVNRQRGEGITELVSGDIFKASGFWRCLLTEKVA